jgi:hypothetical protein
LPPGLHSLFALAELDAIITDNGRVPFEEVIARIADMSEADKAQLIAHHRAQILTV